jgi:hypothetical protein
VTKIKEKCGRAGHTIFCILSSQSLSLFSKY